MRNRTHTGDEEGRIRALQRLDILDTPEEGPFERIVDLVRQVLRVPMSSVSIIDTDRQWFKARRGMNDPQTARDISFCTHTIEQTSPLAVNDAMQDPRFADNPLVRSEPHIRSYLGVPLTTSDGYNIGSLCAIDVKPRDFSAAEIEILQSFADIVVDELQLRDIATTDALSGALTRRAFMERAKAEVARARRHGRALAVAMLDIDTFKQINDRYGHPVGDRVIRALADACREDLRVSDLLGRVGGEEFAIVLPETSSLDAVAVLERIRAGFSQIQIEAGEETFSATVSVGVSGIAVTGPDLDAMIASADDALYKAKLAGRNRVQHVAAHEIMRY